MSRRRLLADMLDEHVILSRVDDVETISFVALRDDHITCSAGIVFHRGKYSQPLASAQMLEQEVGLHGILDAVQFIARFGVTVHDCREDKKHARQLNARAHVPGIGRGTCW